MKNPLKDLINNPIVANPMSEPSEHSRRAFLFKVALLLNGAVGAVLAVPVLGYLLGPFFRKNSSYNNWVPVGNLDQFPPGETRLGRYRNPMGTPADGQTRTLPCWVRHITKNQFQVFAINCAHMDCPVHWFPQSNFSCVLAMVACTTRMARSQPDLRRGGYFSTSTKLSAINF